MDHFDKLTDTIAAIATGMTDAGISIIRISGPDAIKISDKVFKASCKKSLSALSSNTINFGHVYDGKDLIDQVLCSVFRAPKSYTGEDTVEINCHGGRYVTQRILDIVLKNGARLAEPGEFTKRSFLNGKKDLSEAEAVMDIISAKNEFALLNSQRLLRGNVRKEIKELREKILYETAYIESALDDPEHFDLSDYSKDLRFKVKEIICRIEKLIENSKNGKLRKDGISTVLVGKPNAGKSSFMNMLLGEDRAIVTSTAGTTRDVLSETVRIGDIVLNITDTAGIRDTGDEIEKIGVTKAKEYAKSADLLLYMVDSSVPLDENDDDIIEMMHDRHFMVLMNKSDLKTCVTLEELKDIFGDDVIIINISATENLGMDKFEKALKEMFFKNDFLLNDEIVITNTRQASELQSALDSLNLVLKSIDDQMPEDFYSIDLTNAYTHLGLIIGEQIDDDLADEIFSKFCMGK